MTPRCDRLHANDRIVLVQIVAHARIENILGNNYKDTGGMLGLDSAHTKTGCRWGRWRFVLRELKMNPAEIKWTYRYIGINHIHFSAYADEMYTLYVSTRFFLI